MPRKAFDGAKLSADIAHLNAADKVSPPTAKPSLMGAIRMFATFIEKRTQLGWTDAMIARVLTEAGYAIDAATLCSYRKRIADEGLIAPKPTRSGEAPTSISTERASAAVQSQPRLSQMPVNAEPGVVPAEASTAPPAGGTAPRAPPDSPVAPRRTYSIDPTKRPPDRA